MIKNLKVVAEHGKCTPLLDIVPLSTLDNHQKTIFLGPAGLSDCGEMFTKKCCRSYENNVSWNFTGCFGRCLPDNQNLCPQHKSQVLFKSQA